MCGYESIKPYRKHMNNTENKLTDKSKDLNIYRKRKFS